MGKAHEVARFAATASLLAAGIASAGVYTDLNTHNVSLDEGDSVNGQWSYGPIAPGEVVTLVEAWFVVSGSDSDDERYRIQIGTGDSPTEIDQTSSTFEFGSGYTASFNSTNASLLDDAANGLLSYTVSAPNTSGLNNDFTFKTAEVKVTTRSASVPDGGATVALLGAALVGMVGLRRRFSR